MANLWKCPKCGREFEKNCQQHSCTVYPLDKHFIGKEEVARPLYNRLKESIEGSAGKVKVESLPCCIRLVAEYAPYSFACVYALRDRIRIHFASEVEIKSKRIGKYAKTSASKYMNSIDIKSAEEIDNELIGWLKQAYNLKRGK